MDDHLFAEEVTNYVKGCIPLSWLKNGVDIVTVTTQNIEVRMCDVPISVRVFIRPQPMKTYLATLSINSFHYAEHKADNAIVCDIRCMAALESIVHCINSRTGGDEDVYNLCQWLVKPLMTARPEIYDRFMLAVEKERHVLGMTDDFSSSDSEAEAERDAYEQFFD